MRGMIRFLLDLPRNAWKHGICSWLHRRGRCYPEAWGRGLDGPWHCKKCHPCGEALGKVMSKVKADGRPVVDDGSIRRMRRRAARVRERKKRMGL